MADLPPLREVIARHGLSASKALGQNFLFDEQLLDRIAAIPGDLSGKQVLEVGPGPGGLTRALLRSGARVTAIEMDKRCLPALAELGEAFPGQLRVIEGDALRLDHTELMGGEPFAVLSNLPSMSERRCSSAGSVENVPLDQPHADVSAGGCPADCRPARRLDLRPAGGIGTMAQ